MINERANTNKTLKDIEMQSFLGSNSGIRDWQSFIEVYYMGFCAFH